ncbi:MAG: DUF3791 domain-containing protein [Oscillospiraceae bacterium]|nr:DUF3791 domain-containing protein [Oscillospiraceae bacterium]
MEKRRGKREATVRKQTAMNRDQAFFAVFCIEALADALGTTDDKVYESLTEHSDILDGYIVPCYDALHTRGTVYGNPLRNFRYALPQRRLPRGEIAN